MNILGVDGIVLFFDMYGTPGHMMSQPTSKNGAMASVTSVPL